MSSSQKRLNVPMDADLYKKLKMRSAEEDRSISDIVREVIKAYLYK